MKTTLNDLLLAITALDAKVSALTVDVADLKAMRTLKSTHTPKTKSVKTVDQFKGQLCRINPQWFLDQNNVDTFEKFVTQSAFDGNTDEFTFYQQWVIDACLNDGPLVYSPRGNGFFIHRFGKVDRNSLLQIDETFITSVDRKEALASEAASKKEWKAINKKRAEMVIDDVNMAKLQALRAERPLTEDSGNEMVWTKTEKTDEDVEAEVTALQAELERLQAELVSDLDLND